MKFSCNCVLIYHSSITISQIEKYNLNSVQFKYSTYHVYFMYLLVNQILFLLLSRYTTNNKYLIVIINLNLLLCFYL